MLIRSICLYFDRLFKEKKQMIMESLYDKIAKIEEITFVSKLVYGSVNIMNIHLNEKFIEWIISENSIPLSLITAF